VAAELGIRVGDIALTINNQAIRGVETVRAEVKEALEKGASKLALVLVRGEETIELQLPTPDSGVIGITLEEQYEEPVFQ
jgi:S1-C subfamily serine protease